MSESNDHAQDGHEGHDERAHGEHGHGDGDHGHGDGEHGHGDGDHGHHGPTSFWTRYVFSTDHKVIGMQFLFSSLLFVLLGGLLALGVRYQLAWPQQHVPYHKVLPGGTLDDSVEDGAAPRMTNVVPEANLALWEIGGEVVLLEDIDIAGVKAPAGATAKLLAMPSGLAVTLPAGVKVSENDQERELVTPVDGYIDPADVIGDYDYTKLTPHALATPGAKVTVAAANQGDAPRTLTLVSTVIHRPGGSSVEDESKILLAIRADATQVRLKLLEKPVVIEDAERLDAFDMSPSERSVHAQHLLTIVEQNQKWQADIERISADQPVEAAKLARRIEANREQIEVPVKAATIESLAAGRVEFRKHQLTDNGYLSLFTMHASIMIFFVIIPALVGAFGNFLIPLMIGARDMAFPKVNMLSFWISVPVGLLMIASFWVPNGTAGGGWTMYPPLSRGGEVTTATVGGHLWVFGVGLLGFTSILGSFNYITTIINMRAPGMGMFRMPLTVWSLFITALLQLFATPVLTAAMIMLLFDRVLGTMFFAPVADHWVAGLPIKESVGGQPLLFQHLFWFYSHPAVYIMILPAMGIVSDVLATHARKAVFGYKPMVYAISAIAGLGFIVWGHHMFQSGMNPVLGTTFMASTIMIAVPSAVKVFNWLGTLWGGDIRFTPAMFNGIGFVSMFTIGGLSGIFMASTPVDIYIHDTYFIVAHIHYVLFGGSIFGIFAGVYHWFPKFFGRQMNYKWGVIHFWLTLIAFNGTFFLMHILGVGGHPRRYASIMHYPLLQHLQPMNVMMTLWAMSMGLAQVPFFFNFFTSLPRRLGRAIVSVFAVALIGSTVMGVTYWMGTRWQVVEGVSIGVMSGGEALRNWIGYIACIGGLVVMLLSMLRGLPKGGKVAAVLLGVPLVIYLVSIVSWAAGGSLLLALNQQVHNIMVALGHTIIAGVIVTAAVFIVWGVGGALKLSGLLARLMYIVVLPAFLLPFVIKPDAYMQVGLPGLMSYRWLILILLCLPGIAYLVARRPRDEFGTVAQKNPWQSNSLEWVAESPPIHLNFETIPTVYRGPYEYGTPAAEEDHLPQAERLPEGVVEPAGH